MHTKGYRITVLRTLKMTCALYFAAATVTLFSPSDAAALDLNLERTLSQTLGQVAKTTDAVVTKLSNGNGNSQSAKKQATSSNASSSNTQASEPVATPAEPAPVITPQAPPAAEALPPEVESIANLSSIPSGKQLLNLVATPLLSPASLTYRGLDVYPPTIDSFAMVRPSPEGWRIMGIPWTWWVAASGLVWLGNRWLIRRT